MKKFIVIFCMLLCPLILLCACASGTVFQTQGAQYEVAAVETGQQMLEHTASDGNTLLSITLMAADSSLDDAQASFLPVGGEPCYVASNGRQYPCAALAFESNGSEVQAVLLFEVPAGLSGEFTLGGSAFSAVSLKK